MMSKESGMTGGDGAGLEKGMQHYLLIGGEWKWLLIYSQFVLILGN